MSHPYVTKVTLLDGQVVLTVEFDASAAGQPFEIAGHATQNGGAFANFYDVKVAQAAPDGTVVAYVKAPPMEAFKKGEDITVVLRAARVWATVLKQTPPDQTPPEVVTEPVVPPVQGGTTWNMVKKVEWVAPAGSPDWNPGTASAGGASFPPG